MRASKKWATARLLPAVDGRLTAALAVLVLLTGLLPIAIVFATASVVGSVRTALGQGFAGSPGHHALAGLAGLGFSFVLLQVSSTARAAVGSALGWKLNRQLEQRVMAAVAQPAGMGHLEDAESLGRIAAAREVLLAGYRPCEAVPAIASRASAWLQGTGAALVLAGYRWWLATAVFAAWLWRARLAKRSHARGVALVGVKATGARRADYLRDLALTPGAAKEIRVFGLTEWLVARFRAEAASAREAAARQRTAKRMWGVVAAWTTVGVTLAAYLIIGIAAAHGQLSIGRLALYATAITTMQIVTVVGMDNILLEHGTVPVPAVGALEAGLVTPAGEGAGAGANAQGKPAPPGAPECEIRFEDVHFRYPGATRDALDGLDLVLPAGQSLAIVGANGAGKTTLAKLLCRFHEPTAGRITVDGRVLSEFDPRSWQRHVAAVFQDFVRYPLSARDNIAFGAVDRAADPGAVESAARRAGVLNTILALPGGLDTVLSPSREGGTDLSGGEWQRLVLARALFAADAGARVLVLDEPAAHLDARGEAELYERFLDITAGVTTVLVSHRFATVRRAQLIVVLGRGRVVEVGDHDELLAAGGTYARMFRVQASSLAGEAALD